MKITILLVFIFLTENLFAQNQDSIPASKRWEASVGSGLFLDLFFTLPETSPPSYPDLTEKNISLGKVDRLELKYLLSPRSGFSVYIQHAQWRFLYGSNIDPLGLWKEIKRYGRRWQFSTNYLRTVKSGKRGNWTFSSGFQVQIEKISFPFYRIDNSVTPPIVTEIGARPDWTYFEDWAIPLTIAHHWTVNKNLKLGIVLNTAYTAGSGVDGLSLQGNIAIPFGPDLK